MWAYMLYSWAAAPEGHGDYERRYREEFGETLGL